jgi:hypothetical protein
MPPVRAPFASRRHSPPPALEARETSVPRDGPGGDATERSRDELGQEFEELRVHVREEFDQLRAGIGKLLSRQGK